MPRKTNTFKIEGYKKQFEVYELTVKQIIGLIQDKALEGNLSLDDFREYFDRVLPKLSNVTIDELLEMVPSDIKLLWEEFSTTNETFFEVARKSGLESLVGQLKKAIIADFSKWLAGSSKQDTPTP